MDCCSWGGCELAGVALGIWGKVLAWRMGTRDSRPQEDEEPLEVFLTLTALRSLRLLVLGLHGEDLDWGGDRESDIGFGEVCGVGCGRVEGAVGGGADIC